MRKVIIVLIFILLLLSSCSNAPTNNNPEHSRTETSTAEATDVDYMSSPDYELIEKEKNYKIFQSIFAQKNAYLIYDNNGKEIFRKENIFHHTTLKYIDENILQIHLFEGGMGGIPFRYANIKSGKLSDEIPDVSAAGYGKIAYMTYRENNTLIVRDMFDKDIFYRKYLREFSETFFPKDALRNAKFLDENHLLIEYIKESEDKVVKEIINLTDENNIASASENLPSVNKSKSKFDSDSELSLYEKGENYNCYKYDRMEFNDKVYSVYNNKGKIIYESEIIDNYPNISYVDENTLEFQSYGDFDVSLYRYFDIEKGKVSQKYLNIAASGFEKVVYMSDDNKKIIIRDMYDKETFYKEILRDFTAIENGDDILLNARFLSDKNLIIEYRTGDQKEIIKEKILM